MRVASPETTASPPVLDRADIPQGDADMRSGLGGRTAVLLVCCATLAATVLPLHAQQPSPPAARALVHVDEPGARIDRHIYGQFAEHLGRGIYDGVWVGEDSPIPNIHGFRTDVVAALRELHVPVVRWPGGCFADEYHWRDGIGPRSSRPVTLNSSWGGVPESNAFGTHEFLQFAELIGADAYINGNLGTGSTREMAEWLQYMTSDKPTALTAERARNGHAGPWKVAYFAVGNEAWGCGGNMRPEHYVDLFRQVATFLKAPSGARPAIIASGDYDDNTTFTEALISRSQDDIGAISFHYYTLPGSQWKAKGSATGFGEDQWISTLAHTLRMDDFISRRSAILDRYDPGRKVALAVDEWGTWYDPDPGRDGGDLYQQNTLRDAEVAAINFNIFHRHAERVRLANIAQMVNVLQAMILTNGAQMLLTPTYHVFHMFTPFQDATFVPTDLQTPMYTVGNVSVPAVSLSAARATDGSIAVALVNLNPNAALSLSMELSGLKARHVSGQILTAGAMDAHNTFGAPDVVRPAPFNGARLSEGMLSVRLPAKAIVVLRVD
jgi:alpha-N-arabinofuranosidase